MSRGSQMASHSRTSLSLCEETFYILSSERGAHPCAAVLGEQMCVFSDTDTQG